MLLHSGSLISHWSCNHPLSTTLHNTFISAGSPSSIQVCELPPYHPPVPCPTIPGCMPAPTGGTTLGGQAPTHLPHHRRGRYCPPAPSPQHQTALRKQTREQRCLEHRARAYHKLHYINSSTTLPAPASCTPHTSQPALFPSTRGSKQVSTDCSWNGHAATTTGGANQCTINLCTCRGTSSMLAGQQCRRKQGSLLTLKTVKTLCSTLAHCMTLTIIFTSHMDGLSWIRAAILLALHLK